MVLNQATEYGMRTILFLAKQKEGHVIDADTISSTEKIPKRFLFKIMLSLTKDGLVESVRGRNGGFILGRDSHDITLYDIIKSIEGSIIVSHCLSSPDKCSKDATGYCAIHKSMAKLRQELVQQLQNTNIKMLLESA